MDGNLTQVLEQLGLTQVEAKVYLALVENGSQQAGAITKFTGIHRRTVYDAISRLIEKGLLTYIKSGKVKVYQAAHPEQLMELLKEQERSLQDHLPRLEQLFDAQPGRHETVFYRGKQGLKALFDDQLREERTVIRMLGAAHLGEFAFWPQYYRACARKRISIQLLGSGAIPQAEVRKLDVQQQVLTCIYGDSVAIISFAEKPFGILIREQAIADQYKSYFELLWKTARVA